MLNVNLNWLRRRITIKYSRQPEMQQNNRLRNPIGGQPYNGILIKIMMVLKKKGYYFHFNISFQKIADKKFREIAEAYDVLSDPKKKNMFDQGVDPND